MKYLKLLAFGLISLNKQVLAEDSLQICYPYFQTLKPETVIGHCEEDDSDGIQKFKFLYYPDKDQDPNFVFKLGCITPIIKIQGTQFTNYEFSENELSFKFSHQELYQDFLCKISDFTLPGEEKEKQTMECNIEIDFVWGLDKYIQHEMDHSTAISYYVDGDSIVEPQVSPTLFSDECCNVVIDIDTSLYQCNQNGCSSLINDVVKRTNKLTLLSKIDEEAFQRFYVNIIEVKIIFYQNNIQETKYVIPNDKVNIISQDPGSTKFEFDMSLNLGNKIKVQVITQLSETDPSLERRNLYSQEELQQALSEYRSMIIELDIEEIKPSQRNMYHEEEEGKKNIVRSSSSTILIYSTVLLLGIILII